MYLEGSKNRISAGFLDNTPLGLDLGIADLTVIDNDRITACTARGLISPANALGKLGIGIREEKNIIPANCIRLAPGTHHERIIESNDGDNVNSLLAELGQVLDISWHVVDGTGRGEGTGNGEQDDLLVGPLLRGIVIDGDAAGGNFTTFLVPWNVLEDHVARERIAGLDCSHIELNMDIREEREIEEKLGFWKWRGSMSTSS